MERIKRASRPSIEGLEGRRLLSTVHRQSGTGNPAPLFSKVELKYTTAEGSRVDIKVKGPGSLKGSSVDPSGNLNLVFSGTTVFTTISGTVKGGTGFAPLATIRNANLPITSISGVGGELIGRVILPDFDLVRGGNVNLTAGVQVLTLNSVAGGSQIHLRDTPLSTTLGFPNYVNTVTGAGSSYARLTSTTGSVTSGNSTGAITNTTNTNGTTTSSSTTVGLNVINPGTLNPTLGGFGGASVGAINGAIPIIPTVGNGQNYLGTPGLTQTQVDQGRTRTVTTDTLGGTQLTAVGGTFTPGANLIEPSDVSLPPHRVPPPGVIVTIKHVNGGPTTNTPPLGDAQIFGYDATANALVRFDAVTGVALQSIPLPASTSPVGGVALARNGVEQVVLVGLGPNVLAFDAITGATVGQFSTASLAGIGLTTVTGIATGGQSTVLADSLDGPNGTIQAINVARSLATGQAVAVGSPFSPTREFKLAGTITGVPGSGNLYALGSAYLDTTQPNFKQVGVLTITPTGGVFAETARTALTNKGLTIPAGSNNGLATSPTVALGSLDSSLTIGTGIQNGQNIFNLYAPNGLASQGTLKLNDANPLTDLTESFHPELSNTALIDVQGNIQSFTAKSIDGLVLNGSGNFDQLTAQTASDSTVIGLPFAHVDIPSRSNVVILTNSRLVGTRGEVVVNSALKPVGPLFLS